MTITTKWYSLSSFSFAMLLLHTGCSSNFEDLEKDFGKLKRNKTSTNKPQENENSLAICQSALRIQTSENVFQDSSAVIEVEISDSQGKTKTLTLDTKNPEQIVNQLCSGKATLKLFIRDNYGKPNLRGGGELTLNTNSRNEVNIVWDRASSCQAGQLTLQSNFAKIAFLPQPVTGCAYPYPTSFFNLSASMKQAWRTTFTSSSGFVPAEQYTIKKLEIELNPPIVTGRASFVPDLAKLTQTICVGQPQVCGTKVATVFSEQSFEYLVKTLNNVKKAIPQNPRNKPSCASDAPSLSVINDDQIYTEDLGCVSPTFFNTKSLQDAWFAIEQYSFPEECRTIE